MKKYFLFIMLACGISIITSCGGDDVDCTDPNINQEWADEFQAVSNAGTAYVADPSSDNCNAYKDALQNYLDAIREFEECFVTAEDLQEFNQAVQEAQSAINSLSC